MLCAVCGDKALLPLSDGDAALGEIDFALLRRACLRARVEVGNLTQYSASGTQNILERLLDGGHITLRQYLEQLPEGVLPMRAKLMDEWQAKEDGHGK